MKMVKTWSQCILGNALHATKDATTFTAIGTISVTNRADYIWGFYALIVNMKPTADEASSPIMRISSTQLNTVNVTFNAGTIGAEGMAAHQAAYIKKIFIPWTPNMSGEAIHYADIDFSISSVVANTEGWDVGIQLVTSDTEPTIELLRQFLGDYSHSFNDADVAIEAAGAGNSDTLAPWGVGDADSIVLTGGATELIGILYTVTLNAETAGVPLCNYAELANTDVSDFVPQQHLVNAGANGALGTVIDAISEISLRHTPFLFEGLPRAKSRITIADINSLTGLGAGDGILSIRWKKP